jgi:hypothetical protein
MMNIETLKAQLPVMSLDSIARLAQDDWKSKGKIYFGAVPYLDAMTTMDDIKQQYGMDSGVSIVTYFLGNAQTWRGDVAREVKKELNRRIKSVR